MQAPSRVPSLRCCLFFGYARARAGDCGQRDGARRQCEQCRARAGDHDRFRPAARHVVDHRHRRSASGARKAARAAGTTAYSNGNATADVHAVACVLSGRMGLGPALAFDRRRGCMRRCARPAMRSSSRRQRLPAAITFTQNGPPVSVRTDPNDPTRLYGGAITDINHDGWIDFIAINEVSARPSRAAQYGRRQRPARARC